MLIPDNLPGPGSSRRDRGEGGVVETIKQPPARRVRRDRSEQLRLLAQHGDLGDRRGPVGDRDGEIHQHPGRVMPGPHQPQPVQCLRQLAGQRGAVGDIGQQPRPGV